MDDLMTKDQRDKFMAFLLNQRKEIMAAHESKLKELFDGEIHFFVNQVIGDDANMGMAEDHPFKTFEPLQEAMDSVSSRTRVFVNVARGGVYLMDKVIKLPVGAVYRAYGDGYWPILITNGQGEIEVGDYCEVSMFPIWMYSTLVLMSKGEPLDITWSPTIENWRAIEREAADKAKSAE